ncbi:MAG TPA: hypothetical protein PL045_10395, partial [Chitinophagaceae bacterium]|nr:hypothetical protein [Chitinophagaceae bacterium]
MLLVSVHISDEIKAGDIEALQKQLNGSLGNLLAGYGITDELQIEVSIRKFNEPRIALIYINNRVLHTVPFFLAGDTWFFARDMHVEKNNTEVNVMSDLFFSHEDDAKMRLLYDYVCEAVKQNPQMLVSDDFAAELCAAAQMQRTTENITGIKNLLQYVLKYHISVNRFYTRINELQEKTVASLAEDIIESCKNKEIRIACQQQYLMDLVNEYNDGDNDIYKLVDEAMFYELGIDFPDVKFITDEDISYGRFKILVNDFESCAYKGLLPGELIIQKADDYALPASVSKTQTLIHPANGNECWLFYSSQLTAPIEPQVWHPFAFMALHLVY